MSIELSYFINQTICIMCLFLAGYAFTRAVLSPLAGDEETVVNNRLLWALALAYPAGLALWGVCGFLLLVLGVPYNAFTSVGVIVLVIAAAMILFRKNVKPLYLGQRLTVVATALLFLILSIAVVSGIMKISVSNDSYYYYSVYPQTIVAAGKYLTAFDVFLTDVGQTTAIINTMPWLFGFEETYGMQIILGMNLIAVFAMTIFDTAFKVTGNKKKALVIAGLSTLYLITCTPFFVMTRWILANAYFMTFMFIIFALVMRISMTSGEKNTGEWILIALYSSMLSMMRMEGGMITGLLILCACSTKRFTKKDLLLYFVTPVALTQLLYYATIYLKLSVNPLYSFLDYKNAAIMLGFIGLIAIYIAFIRGRGLIDTYYPYLLILVLLLGNGVLLVLTPDRYLGNLKFFILNIYLKNGWGYFGFEMLAFGLLLVIAFIAKILSDRSKYLISELIRQGLPLSLLLVIGDVLFTLAVCWARDGSLRVGIGDSGNRVLMQITPFVIFAMADLFARIFADKED